MNNEHLIRVASKIITAVYGLIYGIMHVYLTMFQIEMSLIIIRFLSTVIHSDVKVA
ncbi:hypothetical protein D3C74_406250 [compost metagenome]